MWVRVSRYQFPAVEIEKVIAAFNEAMETFSKEPGLRRADVLVNRKSGAGITITMWESEAALEASEEEADRLRSEIALELIGWVQSVEQYELVRSDTY
jgi:heme-degrading monooxygenase HmoA